MKVRVTTRRSRARTTPTRAIAAPQPYLRSTLPPAFVKRESDSLTAALINNLAQVLDNRPLVQQVATGIVETYAGTPAAERARQIQRVLDLCGVTTAALPHDLQLFVEAYEPRTDGGRGR